MSAEQDLANANVQIANLISEVTRFRDAAMGINNIWPTTTEGRQNTADGKYFSVPGGGAYLKLYRRAGTSQTLIAEFPDRSQVQTLIDVLGGRGVLGGSGDLLAKNAWGLGMNGPQVDDASNYLSGSLPLGAQANGFRAIVSNEFPSDYPAEAGSWSSVLLNKRNADTGSGMIHSTQNDLYIFRVLSGVVNQVNKLFSNRNVLSPVSMLNSLPSGGLFERGGNSFGNWKKTPEGIVEFFNPSVSLGAGMTDFVLPFEVANTNYHVSITPISTSGVLLGTKVGTRTTQSVPIGLVNASGFVASFVQVRVIAYWY